MNNELSKPIETTTKIRTTNTNIEVNTTTILAVEINEIRFELDERFPWITVYIWDEANLTRIDEVDILNEDCSQQVNNLEELNIFALNWYFNSVEIVSHSEIYKSTKTSDDEK